MLKNLSLIITLVASAGATVQAGKLPAFKEGYSVLQDGKHTSLKEIHDLDSLKNTVWKIAKPGEEGRKMVKVEMDVIRFSEGVMRRFHTVFDDRRPESSTMEYEVFNTHKENGTLKASIAEAKFSYLHPEANRLANASRKYGVSDWAFGQFKRLEKVVGSPYHAKKMHFKFFEAQGQIVVQIGTTAHEATESPTEFWALERASENQLRGLTAPGSPLPELSTHFSKHQE